METTILISESGRQEGTKVIEEWMPICNPKKARSLDKRHRGEFRTADLILDFFTTKSVTRSSIACKVITYVVRLRTFGMRNSSRVA